MKIGEINKQEMQSKIYKKQDQRCSIWLEQNLTPRKTSALMSMLEQTIENKAWKAASGLNECFKCRLCGKQKETVQNRLAGCKTIASSEYITRHNRAQNCNGCILGKDIQFVKKECEIVPGKMVKGTCFGEFSSKAGVGL